MSVIQAKLTQKVLKMISTTTFHVKIIEKIKQISKAYKILNFYAVNTIFNKKMLQHLNFIFQNSFRFKKYFLAQKIPISPEKNSQKSFENTIPINFNWSY